jgi:phosphohistidine phosphatase
VVRRPDVLLTSPLPRARETAEIAAREWGKRVEVTEEPALAGGSVEQISKALERYPGDSTVAIVGHEPDLSELLARILGTPHEERLTFKKGGAAMVELPGSLLDGGGLLWYAPPRVLREAC